jgi:exodeoxyribonuclease-3
MASSLAMNNSLKIVSWNINSIRARLDIVERFLREESPDILCLQETKVRNDQFPEGIFRQLGYNHLVLNGQPMHHGVAMISRVPLHKDERFDWQDNGEARHVGARLENGVRIENVYIPAGGEIPDRELNPKFGQKLDFYERMTRWSDKLDTPTILLGDFNIAPLEADVWSHKQLINVVSHTPLEVETMARLQGAHEWVDIGRRFVPDPERLYTWWSYRARDWRASDKGRRLDHVWVSPELTGTAVSHNVHEDARGWGKPSDHAPLITEFNF